MAPSRARRWSRTVALRISHDDILLAETPWLRRYDAGDDSTDPPPLPPVYVFAFAALPPDSRLLPIHDHCDNITGGGLVVSVYHPGTGLPQQPWV